MQQGLPGAGPLLQHQLKNNGKGRSCRAVLVLARRSIGAPARNIELVGMAVSGSVQGEACKDAASHAKGCR